MNAAYDNPFRDSLPFGGAFLQKAYRRSFAPNKNSLPFIMNDSTSLPEFLRDRYITDITKEYLPSVDLSLKLFPYLGKIHKNIVYIGVLNGQNWQIVHWGIANDFTALFRDMGRKIVYCPVLFNNSTIIPAGNAILLDKSGKIHTLKPEPGKVAKLKYLISDAYWLKPKTECLVIYWTGNSWKPASEVKMLNDNPRKLKENKEKKYLSFENIPVNTLLRIISVSALNGPDYGRPFIIEGDSYKVY